MQHKSIFKKSIFKRIIPVCRACTKERRNSKWSRTTYRCETRGVKRDIVIVEVIPKSCKQFGNYCNFTLEIDLFVQFNGKVIRFKNQICSWHPITI